MKNPIIFIILTTFAAGVLLTSCGTQTTPASSTGPHATVTLRDGTTATGNVLSSSATEIQIAGDDKITRTIPMTQVKSIDYGEAPAAQTAAPAPKPTESASSAAPAPPASQPVASSPAPAPAQSAPAAAPPAEPPHESHYHPRDSAVTTKTYVVAAGSDVSVRTEETIDSGKAAEGQTYEAEVTRDVRDATGAVVIPRGANARIVIRSASKGGKIRDAADLALDLDSVAIDGRRYHLETVDLTQRGRDGVGANKRTAEFAGGGAAVGAIIGAIAGSGKGAAIGAGSGAGAGAVAQILTKGRSVRVPVESVLTFRLERALRVTPR